MDTYLLKSKNLWCKNKGQHPWIRFVQIPDDDRSRRGYYDLTLGKGEVYQFPTSGSANITNFTKNVRCILWLMNRDFTHGVTKLGDKRIYPIVAMNKYLRFSGSGYDYRFAYDVTKQGSSVVPESDTSTTAPRMYQSTPQRYA